MIRRRHLLPLCAMPLLPASATPSPPRLLHVGSYAPLGLGVYSFAIGTDGALAPLGVTPNANSPSWLVAADRLVYAAEEGGDQVAVYAQDDSGRLTLRQRQPSGGQGPVHLSLSHGRLWAAHYGDASFAALPLQPDGRLGDARRWPACAGPDCRPGRPRR